MNQPIMREPGGLGGSPETWDPERDHGQAGAIVDAMLRSDSRPGISEGLACRLRAVEDAGCSEFAWARFEVQTRAIVETIDYVVTSMRFGGES